MKVEDMENWIRQSFKWFDDNMALLRRFYGLEPSRDSRPDYEKISGQLDALSRKQDEQFQKLMDDFSRIIRDETHMDKPGKGEER